MLAKSTSLYFILESGCCCCCSRDCFDFTDFKARVALSVFASYMLLNAKATQRLNRGVHMMILRGIFKQTHSRNSIRFSLFTRRLLRKARQLATGYNITYIRRLSLLAKFDTSKDNLVIREVTETKWIA